MENKTTNQHTPGPWKAVISYNGDNNSTFAIDSANPRARYIADDIENEADANLIASAPELVDAMQGFIDLSNSLFESSLNQYQSAVWLPKIEAAKQALIKAGIQPREPKRVNPNREGVEL